MTNIPVSLPKRQRLRYYPSFSNLTILFKTFKSKHQTTRKNDCGILLLFKQYSGHNQVYIDNTCIS